MYVKSEGKTSVTAQTPLLSLETNTYSSIPQYTMKYFTCGRCQRLTGRKIIMDLLSIMFGVAAWITVNGMFVQLPLLVQTQPEDWSLPSYLSVIVQIGNVGPLSYSLSKKIFHNKIKDSMIIYCVLLLGCVAIFLMSFFYQETTVIFGEKHSIALFVLAFFIALVGCTSSVLFMPYMSNFREIYLIPYFIGEGLSGLLPSVFALIQGVGGNPVCINATVHSIHHNVTSVLESYTPPPRFSSQVFFLILFTFLCISMVSFFLMNNITLCKEERIKCIHVSHVEKTSCSPDQVSENSVENSFAERLGTEDMNLNEHCEGIMNYTPTKSADHESSLIPMLSSRKSNALLLFIAAWVCFLGNGVFPSIQSYSCLPYGNVAYHLAVTLASMANPLACFIALFFPYTSSNMIVYLTLLSTGFSVYIATTAYMSPSPPLMTSVTGEILVVVAWIAFTGLISYVKVSIASVFRQRSQRALFWCGASQQIGSAIGALLIFVLVNFADIFQPYYPCI